MARFGYLVELIRAIRDKRAGKAGGKSGLAIDRVESVKAQGAYTVAGTRLSSTGKAKIPAGGLAVTVWKNGKPVVILAHNARRAQFFPRLPGAPTPVVEMLFIAGTGSATDIWFRNADQVTALNVGSKLGGGAAAATISTVKWGPYGDRFVVQGTDQKYHVFKFDRDQHKAFEVGRDVAGAVTLESFVNLATDATVVAVITPLGTGPSGPVPFSPASAALIVNGSVEYEDVGTGRAQAGCAPIDYFLNSEGHVIIHVRIGANGQGSMPRPEDPELGIPFLVDYVWDVLVDMTTHSVIFTTEGGANLGLGGSLTFNATDLGVLVSPPPFAEAWHLLKPSLIVGTRVLGFQGAARRATYVLPPPVGGVGVGKNASQWSGSLQGPRATEPAIVMPSAASPSSFAALWTLDHALFYKSLGGTGIRTWGGGATGGNMFVLDFATNTTYDVGAPGPYLDRNLIPLPTDFLYAPDNTPVTLPTDADRNFFVDAWVFGGGATAMTSAAPEFPVKEQALIEQAVLKELPAGTTMPSTLGLFDIRIANEQERLGAFFEDYPI